MDTAFVHLHVHSEYSLLDGAARIDDLVQRAKELGMEALALTDHGVMYGAIPFYKACLRAGIKPIIGCEVYFTEGSRKSRLPRNEEPIYHLLLLAKNEIGYQNLMRICSLAHLEGFYYRPRVDFELLQAHREGLICTSACLRGNIPQHLLNGREQEARRWIERYRSLFGGDFYIEIQDHGLLDQRKVARSLVQFAQEMNVPIIATNDVHYIRPEDHTVQDILLCIGTGKTLDDEERFRIETDQLYLKSGQEMARLFRHIPEALTNTKKIADQCQLELDFNASILPEFRPLPEGLTSSQYLRQLCMEGVKKRYQAVVEWNDAAYRKRVLARLDYELSVIESMGYADYFLIVWDFIRFAREKAIVVGPGRGSSAGSLVAYVLQITDVDPIRYGLLFERFLNPERISMPDIDIDFSDERRDEVIDYVVSKYGSDHVAQIITFGTMAARAAVRDVGRVLNMPYAEVDKTAKLIPARVGVTIDDAIQQSPELSEALESRPNVARLIDLARRIEGMPRHASTHAAGVVISKDPLTDHTPLQTGTENIALTQYSMEHLESIGLLKMDFLGLRTLSIMERAMEWIAKQYGVHIDFREIGDEDRETYEMLSRGDTIGVFQLESPGMRRVLKELKPTRFEDIISVGALYRPGPMQFIPQYIAAKHGLTEVEYPHPALEPILKDTYGIIVYQEQIMQIASLMAGFTLGEADLLRRAVSKKNRAVLDEERQHFVEGSVKNGFSASDANRVYDMIVRFADYGFPRAHATAYGVLAYQTAYLKAHYPLQFMASLMVAWVNNARKVAEYAEACRKMNIEVLGPDVNESDELFTPVPDAQDARSGAIRFGLAAVKNVGVQAIDAILKARGNQPFTDLLDFCRRVDLRACNKRVIEALILSGAMDCLPGHRAQLLAMLDDAYEAALKWKKEREDLQLQLFGFDEEVNWDIDYPDVPMFSSSQLLEYEREMLGLFISGHPLDRFQTLEEQTGIMTLAELDDLEDGSLVWTRGIVRSVRNIVTRKGQAMAFMQLEDRLEEIEVVLFADIWRTCRTWLNKGDLVLVKARIQQTEDGVKLIAEDCVPLPESGHLAVYIRIAAGREKKQLQRLRELMERPEQAGALNVVLYYERDQRLLALNDRYRIRLTETFHREVEALFGRNTLRVK